MTYIGPTWWQVLLLTAAGGVVALLAADGWAWLLDAARGGRDDRDAARDVVEQAADAGDGPAGFTAESPIVAGEQLLEWRTTPRRIHRPDCPHASHGKPLWTRYLSETVAIAEQDGLRPCAMCRPFSSVTAQELAR